MIKLEKAEDRYILRIDASAYKESACYLKFYYTTVRGLRSSYMNHKMEYGTAYHKALETFYATGDKAESLNQALSHYSNPEIIIPDSDWRTAGHLANCITQYFETYDEGDGLKVERHEGKPLLEMKFGFPFYTNGFIDVIICGTIDFIGTYFGQNVICDHKSTAVTTIDRYLDSYRMSTQIMLYTLVMRKLFPDRNYQALINGIFLSRTGKNKFQRSPILDYSDTKLAYFEQHLTQTIVKFVELLTKNLKEDKNYFLPNFNCCETKFGMCKFVKICNAGDFGEAVIENDFYSKPYNPLNFNE